MISTVVAFMALTLALIVGLARWASNHDFRPERRLRITPGMFIITEAEIMRWPISRIEHFFSALERGDYAAIGAPGAVGADQVQWYAMEGPDGRQYVLTWTRSQVVYEPVES